ncbi:SU10 major capsid protein [Porphyromonas endodontalis]
MKILGKFNGFNQSKIRYVVANGEMGGGFGKHGVDEIQTRQLTEENSPGLIVHPVDNLLTKIRPQSNPLVVIASRAKRKSSNSQTYKYYSIDTLPDKATLKVKIEGTGDKEIVEVDTSDNNIFSPKETIIFTGVKGYDKMGNVTPNIPLMAYIEQKTSTGKVYARVVNGKKHSTKDGVFVYPEILAGVKILRAGRAHNEKDIQTPPYAQFPSSRVQYIQKFRCQVEETTAQQIANKEVQFTLTDKEEEAVFDMSRGMSKSFWFGPGQIIHDNEGQEVYLCEGIWPQAGKDFVFGTTVSDKITKEDFVALCKAAFVGSNGSKRKTMLCGGSFVENLSLLDLGNDVQVSTSTRFDLTFTSLKTNFGIIDVVHDESMDDCELSRHAFILDEDLVNRVDYLGVEDTRVLNLKDPGIRDTDARVINRACALYLSNPNCHIRVSPRKL